MNIREREIFVKGIYVGLQAAEEFGGGLQREEEVKVKRGRPFSKKKSVERGPHIKWTQEEDAIIENMTVGMKKDYEIAEVLKKTMSQVRIRRNKLGFKKGKDFTSKLSVSKYEGLANVGQEIND